MNECNTSDPTEKSVAHLAINELRSAGSFPNRLRIIVHHIHKFQPPELSPSLPFCAAVNNPESCFARESLQIIFTEMIRNRSSKSPPMFLPAAVKSSLRKIGQTLTAWCIFELNEFLRVVPEDAHACVVTTQKIDMAICAIGFLCGLAKHPEFFVENPGLGQKVDEVIVITWLRTSGLEEETLTYIYAGHAIVIIGPARTATALENVSVEVEELSSLLNHVEHFVNHGEHAPLETSTHGTGCRMQFQEVMSILSMISSHNPDMLHLLNLLGGVTLTCRALSKIMKDPEGYGGWAHPAFGEICSYLYESFCNELTLGLVEMAIRHRLLSSLSRCVSTTERVHPHHVIEVERLLHYLCSVIKNPPILRLACRAVDARSFIASDISGWKKLDNTIMIHRRCWSVDPNAKSGRRCMNPKCTRPYARCFYKCSSCQLPSLAVCSRECQKYLWNELGHKELCKKIVYNDLADDPVNADVAVIV